MISAAAARYLWDAKAAAESIVDFVAGHNLDDYLADKMLRSAVERQFTIIGEALVGLRRISPDVAAAITDIAQIVAFRNVLMHAYASVDDYLVWQVIDEHLPKLLADLTAALARAPEP